MRKSSDVKTVTVLGVKQLSLDAYIRVTERSLTMWDSTDEVRWRMFQLVLNLVTLIGLDNLPGIRSIL
jgi:hypothetical protein